jgi:hypothetical protein
MSEASTITADATADLRETLEAFQQRDGYHKDVIVELLEDFGSFLLSRTNAPLLAEITRLREALGKAEGGRDEAQRENDYLRASLANGPGPCPYCALSKEDWAKCQSGFPGCARADDAMLCPNVGASLEAETDLDAARAEVERQAKRADVAEHMLKVRTRQLKQAGDLWCRAAEKALTGDLSELANRVALRKMPDDWTVVQSDAVGGKPVYLDCSLKACPNPDVCRAFGDCARPTEPSRAALLNQKDGEPC